MRQRTVDRLTDEPLALPYALPLARARKVAEGISRRWGYHCELVSEGSHPDNWWIITKETPASEAKTRRMFRAIGLDL